MEDTNQAAEPVTWLGFKLINQAAADEMSASVLPAANSLSGRVWLALTDSDGDALYVAGIVVAVTFTAAAVRYSVAFPVAPQPKEGVTLYAVVDDVESGLVLAELPEDETVFDAVLTEDAAALIPFTPLVELVPVPAPVLDGVNPLQLAALEGQLVERREALSDLVENDPLAALAVAREVIDLARQVLTAEPVAEVDPLASVRWLLSSSQFKSLTRDFVRSLAVIKGVDEGGERGMDRALFVSSIVGKVKTQAKNNAELAGVLLAWLDMAQSKWAKPAITARNSVWASVEGWERYKPLFAPVPVPVSPAVAELEKALYVVETNEPINREEGNHEQADLEAKTADSIKEAIDVLTKTDTTKVNMENYIKIAAETIAQLRRIDVYRVLNSLAADNIDGVTRADLANYIATSRPDLAREVTDVMTEEWPELGWTLATVEPTVATGNAELEAAGFKNVSGNEWAKGVQGDNGKLNLNIRVFGTPEQFKLKKSATFAGGISGSPSQEVGTYGTAAEVIAAAQAEAAAFAPAAELLVPNEDGAPKELTMPPIPTEEVEQAQNPARAGDLAFLNSVISRSVDMWDDALADKIEGMGTTYEGDAEVMEVWGRAIASYTDFMVAAMG